VYTPRPYRVYNVFRMRFILFDFFFDGRLTSVSINATRLLCFYALCTCTTPAVQRVVISISSPPPPSPPTISLRLRSSAYYIHHGTKSRDDDDVGNYYNKYVHIPYVHGRFETNKLIDILCTRSAAERTVSR